MEIIATLDIIDIFLFTKKKFFTIFLDSTLMRVIKI